MLENKLGATTQAALAKLEEKISKKKAKDLFESGDIHKISVGTFEGLARIHQVLFEDIYPFAGKTRTVNISKNDFLFAPAMYLSAALAHIDQLPHTTFDEIVTKYVEMNIAHPFREGNGRAMRIWLDMMFRSVLGKVVDWNSIDKEDYLSSMRRSPINALEIKHLLSHALTDDLSIHAFIKGLDASYNYEGYYEYKTEAL